MTEPSKPEFDILDSEGLEYHRWVSDVETTFVGKDYTSTLNPPTENGPSEKEKANALMFLRRHIDPSLRWEYLHLKTPKELWEALKARFGNIHNTLLPELEVQWNEIRLVDYKRVNDFYRDMLRLKARLQFCGKEYTDDDMIKKTLSTFPTSSMILANQYRLEYDNKRITTFSKLINLLQVAERHNEILVNNNARPIGTKKIPEANYSKKNGGKNPKEKGFQRTNPYSRGNNGSRGRGRGRGRGSRSNTWHKNKGSNVHDKKPQKDTHAKKERVGNEPCYRCGGTDHWHKHCQASNTVAANYKKYIESKEREAHYLEEECHEPNVNFTITDFSGKKEFAPTMDVPDFD